MSDDQGARMGLGCLVPSNLRCLIVVPSLSRAGAETQAMDLANGLSARGHSIHLCSFEPQLDLRDRLSDKVQFHHILRRSKYDMSLLGRITEVIDREKINVVLGVMEFATMVAWLAARKSVSKPPTIAAIHTTINRGPKQELFDRLVYRRMLRRLPAVVFVCEHQREHWVTKYPELKGKSIVVHNGVAPEKFRRDDFAGRALQLRADLNISADTFVISCVAAFRPEKGHKILIEAFSKIDGDTCLVFAGEGDLRPEMESYADANGLKSRTRFLGNIPDTRPLIVASNVTVLASTAVETFSMAMLESMALGVPMIAPRIGGLPEAIIDGETGHLFPIGDVQSLADCLRSVVENPSRPERMGRLAARKVSEEFTYAKMVAGSERVLISSLK